MKQILLFACAVLLVVVAGPSFAAEPGPGMMGMGQGMGMGPQHRGMMDGEPPCMQMPNTMPGMMGNGRGMGMMQRMGHMLYIDQAEALELSDKQVMKLKAIHSDCQKDNIRTSAEARIVRLELGDLLATDDWSLDSAEPLVRKMEKLQGDIHLRHLQALNEARKVLSAEQLKKARSLQANGLDAMFE